MKKAIIILAFMGLTSQHAMAAEVYAEGSFGFSRVNDVTERVSGIKFEMDSGTAGGIELGVRSFERHDVLRLAASYQRVTNDLDRLTFEGITLTADEAIELFELGDVSKTLRSDLYSLNLHYDFPSNSRWIFSAGVGLTLLNASGFDSTTGFSMIGSARYMLNDSVSLGVKAQTTRASSIKTRNGQLEADKYSPASVTATLSFYF